MDLWAEIRRRTVAGELSLRQARSAYRLNFRTVRRIVESGEPIACQQTQPRARPALGPSLDIARRILEAGRHAPPKRRPTARRIFDRRCDGHRYAGRAGIARAAVAEGERSA